MVIMPAVHATTARIHKEVADGAELQAELLGDGDLHFLGGAAVLSEDGYQGATLQVGEDQSLLLWHLVAVSSSVLLLTFTCWREEGKAQREGGERTEQKRGVSFSFHNYSLNTKFTIGWDLKNNATR